jgi:hypothetical protein
MSRESLRVAADTFPPADPGPTGVWLIDLKELSRVVSLSLRTLQRIDACRDIPGRVVVGRRVLFQADIVRAWVRAGLPDREKWAAIQKRNGAR